MTSSARSARSVKGGQAASAFRAARLLALQSFYQMRLTGVTLAQLEEQAAEDHYRAQISLFPDEHRALALADDLKANKSLFLRLLRGVSENHPAHTAALESLTPLGKSAPEPLLDALILLAIEELSTPAGLDQAVIINEYVSLAASFFDPGAVGLVNARLDQFAASL